MTPNTRLNKLAKAVLAGVVVFALSAGTIKALEAKGAEASVSYMKGTVEKASRRSGPWSELKVGSGLKTGDVVRTGDASRVEIKLKDGSVIRLSAKSQFKLQNLAVTTKKKERKVGMKLFFGKVWSKVSKAFGSGDSEFEVETENAVAGVRGTTFRMNASKDGSALVRVYAGAVAVSNNPMVAMGKKSASKKPERRQVGKPAMVSKEKYEEILIKAMQEVDVSNTGKLKYAEFEQEADAKDDWVAWNNERDKDVK